MSIRVLGICATPVKGETTNTESLLDAILDAAKARGEDIEVEKILLSEKKIVSGCDHCNFCLRRQTADKYCSKNDDMNEIYPKLKETDALILATPVYFGRLSWLMAQFIDRLRCFGEGKYYGIRGPIGGILKDKVFGCASVSWVRHAGIETAQLSMLSLPIFFGMIPVSGGGGYGVGGVSASPLGEKVAIKKDVFALNAAQRMGARVVEMAQIVKAGKEAIRNQK
ncbi:MAG: flavodoxin family protein [Candidatus Tectomicrobia bacterium]|uniref:Flavodoxin family protein n=1 Tax=Tectimicrobiota bacterium TaxID=2528274 RepID=A0A933GNG4_UNCTE|nr:flavodoxin family protein [Candidatus Tectomicrobia bacterium]